MKKKERKDLAFDLSAFEMYSVQTIKQLSIYLYIYSGTSDPVQLYCTTVGLLYLSYFCNCRAV